MRDGSGKTVLSGLVAAVAIALSAVASASAGSNMYTGGITSQPIGHYEFCLANPHECEIQSADRGPFVLRADIWDRVVRTNRDVNAEIVPISDADLYGRDELWIYPDAAGAGDCEDYVLEKQRRLIAMGIPRSALLITVVRKPDGEGHAVLTFRTDRGDYVLDNLETEVKGWAQTPYHFLKRQSSTHAGQWVSLRSGNEVLVGSVRPSR